MSKMSSKNSVSHEYCQGYVDKNGIWNNGFYCRRWGGQDATYCCGDGKERFCCPEVPHLVTPTGNTSPPTDRFNHIPVIIGICVAVVVVVIIIVTGVCCFCCSCCPIKRRQRMRKQSSSIVLNGTIPICTEAEATSSVIAAEALLVPGRDFALYPPGRCGVGGSAFRASPSPSNEMRQGYGGGGGRPWSPTLSSQMDDFDTLFITSLYHHNDTHDLSWHPELQNLCNCNYRPNLKLEPKLREQSLLMSASATGVSVNQSSGSTSTLGFDSLTAKRSHTTDAAVTPPYSKHPTLELQRQRLSPFRLGEVVLSSQGQTQQREQQPREPFRLAAGMVIDADRHKRDSGVLVEEQDTSDNSSSPFCTSLASDDQLTIVR